MADIIRIVGAPATGKSTLRGILSTALGLPSFGIDDIRVSMLRPGEHWPVGRDHVAWAKLNRAIDECEACIVETQGTSERDVIASSTLTILCTATTEDRQARLEQRVAEGHPLARGRRAFVTDLLMSAGPRFGDLTFDSSRPDPVAPVLTACREFLGVA